jgi:PAS domain S-box-containing protein
MDRISRLLGLELVDRVRLTADGEIRNIEHDIVTKSGTSRALLVHIKQVAISRGTILYVCRDITERKAAERALRQNEERLTLALEAASMGTWDWHVPSGEMNWSPETHRIFGDRVRSRTPSYDSFLELLHPSDRRRVSDAMSDAMAEGSSYETEFRVVGYDDVERWVMGKGRALRNGKPLRMVGVFVDFTDRHRVEEELRELSGRLIHAHEQERRRLARDLHDDVAQRVGLLAVELGMLRQQLGRAPAHIRTRVDELSAQAGEIGSELHRFSRELHPVRLEQLGLEASIRSFCSELAEARQIEIHIDLAEAPGSLPPGVALCLYRITQEALHNVVKHSGAASAAVSLSVAGDEALLCVTDRGAGFDPLAARAKDSLGLRSMRERVRLVHGHLVVASAPGEGTRVEVRVPLRKGRQR